MFTLNTIVYSCIYKKSQNSQHTIQKTQKTQKTQNITNITKFTIVIFVIFYSKFIEICKHLCIHKSQLQYV